MRVRTLRRVQQIDLYGCGVACLAMVTGYQYEYMLYRVALRKVRLGKTTFRMLHHEIESMLHRLGNHYERRRFSAWKEIPTNAIVFVHPAHWVVFVKRDGRGRPYVLDPWPGCPGRRYEFRGLRGRGFYIALSRRSKR